VSRYRFIAAEKACYPIAVLCRVVGVPRSGFYAWHRRGLSPRAQANRTLTARLVQLHLESRQTYGAPRLTAALAASGERVGHNRVARLLRLAGMRGVSRRRRVPRTTIADPAAAVAPNVLGRVFTAPASDLRWVGDITYLPTGEGWLYLATLLDVYSRRVVGFALAAHLRTELALEALQLALGQRRPQPGTLVHHTDRGCQYTARAYQAVLARYGITPSMSRAGDCYDNALAESFNATIKTELVARTHWPTRQEARTAVFEWITVFYNRQRRHSSLGYQTPAEFETSSAGQRAA
jgi:transposase InsO family protein